MQLYILYILYILYMVEATVIVEMADGTERRFMGQIGVVNNNLVLVSSPAGMPTGRRVCVEVTRLMTQRVLSNNGIIFHG